MSARRAELERVQAEGETREALARAAEQRRRRRILLTASGIIALVFLAGFAGMSWQWRVAQEEATRANEQKRIAEDNLTKAEKAEKEATEQRNRADDAAEGARQNLFFAQMHLAQQAWREYRGLPHMRELLTNWLPGDKSPDRRGWEWFYLNSLPYQNLRTLTESASSKFVERVTRDSPCTVAWHIARNRLAEGTVDGLIRIWDVDREQTIISVNGPAPVGSWGSWGGWLGWSPDGTKLAAGGKDGTVHLWETDSGRELHVLRGHKSPVWSVAFSAGGTRVAAWEEDGTVKIWDANTGQLSAEVVHPGDVHAGAWSPDGKLLASGHGDGTVTVSGTQAGDKTVTMRGHAGGINSVAWSPDGTRLASASQDFTARIWDVALGKTVLGPLRHSLVITALAWEPDGQRLATGSADERVKIWNATTGREVVTLRGHFQTITSLSWGPGGRLASGCRDGSMRIWTSIRDQEASLLPGHDVRVRSVSWSPDGKRLASCGDDGMVRIWDPVTREEVLTLKGHEERRVIEHHPEAAAGVGDLYAAEKDWERAIAEYRKLATDQGADIALLTKLATAYQSADRTREAVPHLAKVSAANPKDTLLSLKLAALEAWFGQEKELAATLQRIRAFAKDTNDWWRAEPAAKACSIVPSANKAELDAALALARKGVELGKGGEGAEWRLLALGMAEYRSGNAAAAEEALLGAEKAGPNNPMANGIAAFYRAMSLFRQGKADEARELAIAATARMKPLPKDEQNPFANGAYHDDLILWLAYKEAKALIKFDAAPATPATPNGR
jgi:WD40 repeat protein